VHDSAEPSAEPTGQNRTTHCNPVNKPSDFGMVPVSWLSYSSKSLQKPQTLPASRKIISVNSITTHCNPVSEPSDSGIAPVSWLLLSSKYLQ
jgi:hypothetical protein